MNRIVDFIDKVVNPNPLRKNYLIYLKLHPNTVIWGFPECCGCRSCPPGGDYLETFGLLPEEVIDIYTLEEWTIFITKINSIFSSTATPPCPLNCLLPCCFDCLVAWQGVQCKRELKEYIAAENHRLDGYHWEFWGAEGDRSECVNGFILCENPDNPNRSDNEYSSTHLYPQPTRSLSSHVAVGIPIIEDQPIQQFPTVPPPNTNDRPQRNKKKKKKHHVVPDIDEEIEESYLYA